jgi:apolipoprotein D and lipocalin family protein
MGKKIYLIIFTFSLLFIFGCLNSSNKGNESIMKTVEYVDIERFMGDWYVIANIPTFIEKEATNAIESYRLDDDGNVATTFTFFKKSSPEKKVEYTPKGFIVNKKSNAEWAMQFLWPFKSKFLIINLDKNYQITVIGHPSKKYVWIMSRNPAIEDEKYESILGYLSSIGYDISKIKEVPQEWD